MMDWLKDMSGFAAIALGMVTFKKNSPGCNCCGSTKGTTGITPSTDDCAFCTTGTTPGCYQAVISGIATTTSPPFGYGCTTTSLCTDQNGTYILPQRPSPNECNFRIVFSTGSPVACTKSNNEIALTTVGGGPTFTFNYWISSFGSTISSSVVFRSTSAPNDCEWSNESQWTLETTGNQECDWSGTSISISAVNCTT